MENNKTYIKLFELIYKSYSPFSILNYFHVGTRGDFAETGFICYDNEDKNA